MDKIEELMSKFPNVDFTFEKMPIKLGGLTIGNQIAINNLLDSEKQYQWLLEELGHYRTSVGDISDYNVYENMKQEKAARNWGYQHTLSQDDVMKISEQDVDNDYEVAEYLGLQVNYLHKIGESYGLHYKSVN